MHWNSKKIETNSRHYKFTKLDKTTYIKALEKSFSSLRWADFVKAIDDDGETWAVSFHGLHGARGDGGCSEFFGSQCIERLDFWLQLMTIYV